jgi:hypothetical protein
MNMLPNIVGLIIFVCSILFFSMPLDAQKKSVRELMAATRPSATSESSTLPSVHDSTGNVPPPATLDWRKMFNKNSLRRYRVTYELKTRAFDGTEFKEAYRVDGVLSLTVVNNDLDGSCNIECGVKVISAVVDGVARQSDPASASLKVRVDKDGHLDMPSKAVSKTLDHFKDPKIAGRVLRGLGVICFPLPHNATAGDNELHWIGEVVPDYETMKFSAAKNGGILQVIGMNSTGTVADSALLTTYETEIYGFPQRGYMNYSFWGKGTLLAIGRMDVYPIYEKQK